MELLDDPFNLLRGFFTIYSLYSFIAGVALTTLYHKSREWREAKTMKKPFRVTFNKSWVVMFFTVLVILFIGFKTQVTADLAERTNKDLQQQVTDYKTFSKQTQDCLNELLDSLRTRAQITLQDSALDQEERQANREMILRGVTIYQDSHSPQEVEVLWKTSLDEYNKKLIDIQTRRAHNQKERVLNPIPDPTCGGIVQPPK